MDFLGVCFKIRGSGFELKIADNQCLRVPPYIARYVEAAHALKLMVRTS